MRDRADRKGSKWFKHMERLSERVLKRVYEFKVKDRRCRGPFFIKMLGGLKNVQWKFIGVEGCKNIWQLRDFSKGTN